MLCEHVGELSGLCRGPLRHQLEGLHPHSLDGFLILRDELERERAFIRRSEERNLKSLASIYEAMAPDEAAGRLALMDDDTAAKLVSRMSERKAGKVLGALETPRAVAVTRRMKSLTDADAPTSRPEAR